MLISRHIQTRPEMDKEEQTSSEKATQVPRMGLYVLKENDKVLPFSGHYMSAEEMERNSYRRRRSAGAGRFARERGKFRKIGQT